MMRKSQPARFGPGFTLLEMMVAVAILGIVLVMLSESFHAVAASKTQGEARLRTDREARAILWQMGNELRGAVQTPIYPSHVLLIGNGQMRNGVPVDSLTVSTLTAGHSRALLGFGAEQIVTYSISPNPNHPGWFVLSRSQSSALLTGTTGLPSPPTLILADNLVSLHLRYFNGAQWIESWNSSALTRNQQLPLGVTIDLKLADPGGRVMNFGTAVDLPMGRTLW